MAVRFVYLLVFLWYIIIVACKWYQAIKNFRTRQKFRKHLSGQEQISNSYPPIPPEVDPQLTTGNQPISNVLINVSLIENVSHTFVYSTNEHRPCLQTSALGMSDHCEVVH